jgi:DNA-binding ferritin-like protein
MTGKSACGNCGSKAGCGCATPNPYEQGVQVVWHDPTTYDVTKHGPSFLPKLGSAQKAEVRAFVKKQAASYDTGPMQPMAPGAGMPWILACLRALAHVHQTHHWQTSGPSFFADHQLFERLYNESLEFIDQVAERAVGAAGPGVVNAHQQIDTMHLIVKSICGEPQAVVSPDQMIQHSLRGEVVFLGFLTALLGELEEEGQVTPGTRNLLEGVGDKHETFVYLLQQRLGGPAGRPTGGQAVYSYERG